MTPTSTAKPGISEGGLYVHTLHEQEGIFFPASLAQVNVLPSSSGWLLPKQVQVGDVHIPQELKQRATFWGSRQGKEMERGKRGEGEEGSSQN